MKSIAILIPIYPAHYWRGYDLLDSYRRYRYDREADIYFVFTNEEEESLFKYRGGGV